MARQLTVLALCTALTAAAEGTVRVVRARGGPRVLADGQALPLRCFFGSRRSGLLEVGPDWRAFSYPVTPDHAVEGTGTLHFRFESKAATWWLRELRIRDAATGADVFPVGSLAAAETFAATWNTWPPGERNTVGTVRAGEGLLEVVLRAPPDGAWPDFHLHSDIGLRLDAGRSYEVSFEARTTAPGQLRSSVYSVEAGTWHPVGEPPGPFLRQLALARDAGVRFVSTSMPACWTPPGQPRNWGPLEAVFREILAVHPDALVIPRVSGNAPAWWLQEHPEDVMRFEDGSTGTMATVSSRRYRTEAAAHLEALCRHLLDAFPGSFAGIHPCGQNTGEWFYAESWGRKVSGYEPATRDAWGAWLRSHGIEGIQGTVPEAARRHAAPEGFLRHPPRERDLVLFQRFWQEEMADFVLELAAACRRGTEGRKLVVFFYGYGFEFPPLFNGAPYSGHYALERVLSSPDIDVLCSPVSYFDRQWLGTGACMSAAESVALAGKLWLNEDDTRTHLARTTQYGGVADLRQTLAVLRRNTAQAAIRGFGTWWMDLPGEGWFDDPAIWEEHSRLVPLDAALLDRETPFAPEIALVLDETSMCCLSGGSAPMARPLIYEARAAAGRCGAPYGQYLLPDVAAGRTRARLQVFLAAWDVDAEQRQALLAGRPAGVTRVWAYATTCALPEEAGPVGVDPVCGFLLRRIALDDARSLPTAAGKALGMAEPWGQNGRIEPLHAVTPDPGDEVLAQYADGSPSMVLRRRPDGGADVFAGTPAWTPAVFRALARVAGVHLYTDTEAAVWATDGCLSVHALGEGPLALDIGTPAAVVDALSGEALGTGPKVVLMLGRGETRVVRWQAGTDRR